MAGEVFIRLTGLTIHDAPAEEIAGPLGFEDYDPARQKVLRFPVGSQFPACHMFLSARDMARVGLMAMQDGRWHDREIIPVEWIARSTAMQVRPEEKHGVFRFREMGYGRYWWAPQVSADERWQGAFMGPGYFGQMLSCVPKTDTVIVHRRSIGDERVINRHLHGDTSEPPLVTSSDFLGLARLIVGPPVPNRVATEICKYPSC